MVPLDHKEQTEQLVLKEQLELKDHKDQSVMSVLLELLDQLEQLDNLVLLDYLEQLVCPELSVPEVSKVYLVHKAQQEQEVSTVHKAELVLPVSPVQLVTAELTVLMDLLVIKDPLARLDPQE